MHCLQRPKSKALTSARSPFTHEGNDPNYGVTTTQIEDDLTKDRPMWLLSCYGPGKNAPRQLFGGQPREQSFEEMRVRAYELGSAGNIAQYQQEEAELIRIAEEQVLKAVKESRNAVKFVADGDKEHPNRHDIVNKLENHSTDTGGAPFAGNPFANVGHQASTGGFNQPANNPPPAVDPFRVSPFSTPAPQQGFGFQNMPATTTATAFGGPTTLGSGTFGQATQLGNNTFGQPGQSGAPSTGFTQQQAPSFGSNLSVPQNPQGFSQPNNASAPQQPTGASGFPFNAPQWKTTPQAPASMQSNPTQPQPALFGQPFSQTSNILGTSAAPQQFGVSGFPSTNSNGSTAPSVAPVAQAPTPALQSLPGSGQPLVPGQPNPNATYSCDGRLLTWHNQPVTWVDGEPCIKRPQDGLLQRIWFPNGAPVPGRAPLPEEEIGFGRPDDLVLMERYKRASQMGDWDDEGVPELSPRREWVDYDM
ncbi:hypothetical protein MMC25_002353 [Agyrium rufum]|nr:hypothetical protein [Agyrium rufum]